MPNNKQAEQSGSGGGTSVWLVRAGGQQDGAVVAFWERIDAEAYVEARGAVKSGAPWVVSAVVVQGDRRRCQLCGEPIVLDDPSDTESWCHADDANDLGDHTAEA